MKFTDYVPKLTPLAHFQKKEKKKKNAAFFCHVINLRIYMVMAFSGTQAKLISQFNKTKEILFCATIFLII